MISPCLQCASSFLLISCSFFKAYLKSCLHHALALYISKPQESTTLILKGTCTYLVFIHVQPCDLFWLTLFWIFVLRSYFSYMNICSSQVEYKFSKDRARYVLWSYLEIKKEKEILYVLKRFNIYLLTH